MHSPVWKWIDEIIEIRLFFWKTAENSFLCFMFNKKKSCGTRISAIFWDQNGKKPSIFLESLDFHRFTFTMGSAHLFCFTLFTSSEKKRFAVTYWSRFQMDRVIQIESFEAANSKNVEIHFCLRNALKRDESVIASVHFFFPFLFSLRRKCVAFLFHYKTYCNLYDVMMNNDEGDSFLLSSFLFLWNIEKTQTFFFFFEKKLLRQRFAQNFNSIFLVLWRTFRWWDIRPKERKVGFFNFSALESGKSFWLNSEKILILSFLLVILVNNLFFFVHVFLVLLWDNLKKHVRKRGICLLTREITETEQQRWMYYYISY